MNDALRYTLGYRSLTEFQKMGVLAAREKHRAPQPRRSPSSASTAVRKRFPLGRMVSQTTAILCLFALSVTFWWILANPHSPSVLTATNIFLAVLWIYLPVTAAQSFLKGVFTMTGPLADAARGRLRYDYSDVLTCPAMLYRAEGGPIYRLHRLLFYVPSFWLIATLIDNSYIISGLAMIALLALENFTERGAIRAVLTRLEDTGQRAATITEGPQEVALGPSPFCGAVAANLETREAIGVQPGDEILITNEENGKTLVRNVVRVPKQFQRINDTIFLCVCDHGHLGIEFPPRSSVRLRAEKNGGNRPVEVPVNA